MEHIESHVPHKNISTSKYPYERWDSIICLVSDAKISYAKSLQTMATLQLRSNSAGSEPSVNLPWCWYSMESTDIASTSLNDTERAHRQLLDDDSIMSSMADWVDWTGQLNDTGPVPSSSDGVVLSNQDSLDTEFSHMVNAHSKCQPLDTSSFKGSIFGAADPINGTSLYEGFRRTYDAHLGKRGNVLWLESGVPRETDGFGPPGTHDQNDMDFYDMDGSEHSSNQDPIENHPCSPLDDGYHPLFPQNITSLSPSEEKRLLAIAMPGYEHTLDNPPSAGIELPMFPTSLGVQRMSAPHRKRKASPVLPPPLKARKSSHGPPPRKKCLSPQAHNVVEKKYRRNLNYRIDTLRRCVPSLCHASFPSPSSTSRSPPPRRPQKPLAAASKSPIAVSLKAAENSCDDDDDDDDDDNNNQRKSHRCTKATIITKAREHILDQELAIKRLCTEVAGYRTRIVAFEALERDGARVRIASGGL